MARKHIIRFRPPGPENNLPGPGEVPLAVFDNGESDVSQHEPTAQPATLNNFLYQLTAVIILPHAANYPHALWITLCRTSGKHATPLHWRAFGLFA